MSPQYFGGEPTNLGRVAALPAKSFADLVAEIGDGVPIDLSQADLLALPEREQNERKKTRYIVPCAFKTSPSPRQTGHATAAGLICIDIDDSAEAGRLLKIGFEKALGDLNSLVWHTARSTPDAPRLRVVVETLPVPIPLYAPAVTAMAGLLGMNSVNHESKVPVQPMYFPLAFKDADGSPIVYSKTDGRVFDPSALEGMEQLRGAQAAPTDADIADIDYLRAPVDGLTRDEIADALTKIPADCSMQQWVEIGMALKHQFGETGFTLWDDWSATAPEKYPSTEELAKRWESLKANPKDRVPVTIRTVVKMATDNGWNNRPMTTKLFDAARQWIRSDARTGEELLNEGAKRIAKLSGVLGPLDTKVLVQDLHSTIKARGLRGPTMQDVSKEVSRMANAAKAAASVQPPWASNIAFLTAPNLFYRPLDNRKMRREVVDLIHRSPLPDKGVADYLIHDVQIPVVENLRYDPAQKRIFTVEGVPFINTYRPSYPKSDPSMADDAGRAIIRHFKNLFGKYWRPMVDFIAYQVQHGGEKIRWAVFVQSAQGAGKGTVAYIIELALGRTNVQRLSAEFVIEGSHNGWATGFQMTIVDEVWFASHRDAMRVMDKFKTLISDDFVSVRNLYEPVQTVPNNTNWMLFSNRHDALVISADDRRWMAIQSPLQNKAQVLSLGSSYFPDLYAHLNQYSAGVRPFFEQWKISSEFDPNGHAPQTDFLHEMARLTASPLRRAVQDAIEDQPHPLVRRDLISLTSLRGVLPRDGLPPFSDQGLAGVLREEGYTYLGRFTVDGNRHALWSLVPHADPALVAQQRMDLL